MLNEKEPADYWDLRVSNEGLTYIPDLLISINKYIAPDEPRISPTEMVVLFILISVWQKYPGFPVTAKHVLAENLGMSSRQVQRALSSLEHKGYIDRISRFEKNIRSSNAYDLGRLMEFLGKVALTKTKTKIAA